MKPTRMFLAAFFFLGSVNAGTLFNPATTGLSDLAGDNNRPALYRYGRNIAWSKNTLLILYYSHTDNFDIRCVRTTDNGASWQKDVLGFTSLYVGEMRTAYQCGDTVLFAPSPKDEDRTMRIVKYVDSVRSAIDTIDVVHTSLDDYVSGHIAWYIHGGTVPLYFFGSSAGNYAHLSRATASPPTSTWVNEDSSSTMWGTGWYLPFNWPWLKGAWLMPLYNNYAMSIVQGAGNDLTVTMWSVDSSNFNVRTGSSNTLVTGLHIPNGFSSYPTATSFGDTIHLFLKYWPDSSTHGTYDLVRFTSYNRGSTWGSLVTEMSNVGRPIRNLQVPMFGRSANGIQRLAVVFQDSAAVSPDSAHVWMDTLNFGSTVARTFRRDRIIKLNTGQYR